MNDLEDQLEEVQSLVREIGQLLHGKGPSVQGAVLVDLTAMWLAGHIGPAAEQVREQLLENHIKTIRRLIPINEKMLLENLPRRS